LFVGLQVKLLAQVLVHELPQPFRTAAQVLFANTPVVLLQDGCSNKPAVVKNSNKVNRHESKVKGQVK
jgi:hypothetical protein